MVRWDHMVIYTVPLFIMLLAYLFLLFRLEKWKTYSNGILVLCLLSIVGQISLAQTYTHSLIPGIYDGIGIANDISLIILGDDQWSVETFRRAYEWSTNITVGLIGLYMILLLIEKWRRK